MIGIGRDYAFASQPELRNRDCAAAKQVAMPYSIMPCRQLYIELIYIEYIFQAHLLCAPYLIAIQLHRCWLFKAKSAAAATCVHTSVSTVHG